MNFWHLTCILDHNRNRKTIAMHYNPEEHRPDGFLSKFESMLKANKMAFFDSDEFEEIIIYYLDHGKATMAKRALKFALEQHPHSVSLQLAHAEILIYEDKIEHAETILYDLLKVEPFNDEIYIQIASIFSKKDDHQKAIEQLKIAAKYSNDLADVYNLMGMEYLFLEQLEEAKSCFITCLDNDLEDYTALYNVVYCYEYLEQYEEGILFLEDFINKNPYSQVAWHQQGRLLYILKKYPEALTAFDFAFIIDEFFTGALIEKAKCYEKLGKVQDAIACYLYASELEDGSSYVFLRLGKCFEKIKDYEKALHYFSKTTKEDPLLDKGWLGITDFYVHQKNNHKALYYIKKAIEIDRDNLEYWCRYIQINYSLANYEEVIYGYHVATKIKPLRQDFLLKYIDSYINLNDLEEAINLLVEANFKFPKNRAFTIRLAGILLNVNNKEFGFKYLKEVLDEKSNGIETFKNLFPETFEDKEVQSFIKAYLK